MESNPSSNLEVGGSWFACRFRSELEVNSESSLRTGIELIVEGSFYEVRSDFTLGSSLPNGIQVLNWKLVIFS